MKDAKKQIQGIKNNLESIVDIVKVFQNHFEHLREEKKKWLSTSPKGQSVISNRTGVKKQALLGTKIKKRGVKNKIFNQAALTDTESNKMHDLLKKGYVSTTSKPKRNMLGTGRAKSKSTSGVQPFKNKLKAIKQKNLSNSRSPIRADSRSTSSNRKIKSTIASTDLKRSHQLHNSGDSVSIASEKPKAVYFKNTLESHNKIKLSSTKNCIFSLKTNIFHRYKNTNNDYPRAKREVILKQRVFKRWNRRTATPDVQVLRQWEAETWKVSIDNIMT